MKEYRRRVETEQKIWVADGKVVHSQEKATKTVWMENSPYGDGHSCLVSVDDPARITHLEALLNAHKESLSRIKDLEKEIALLRSLPSHHSHLE